MQTEAPRIPLNKFECFRDYKDSVVSNRSCNHISIKGVM